MFVPWADSLEEQVRGSKHRLDEYCPRPAELYSSTENSETSNTLNIIFSTDKYKLEKKNTQTITT